MIFVEQKVMVRILLIVAAWAFTFLLLCGSSGFVVYWLPLLDNAVQNETCRQPLKMFPQYWHNDREARLALMAQQPGHSLVILTLATGKYLRMVFDNLAPSIQQFMKCSEKCRLIHVVFTDRKQLESEEIRQKITDHMVLLETDFLPWPYSTLKRFHAYQKADFIIRQATYVMILDADLALASKLELSDVVTPDLYGTFHPTFYKLEEPYYEDSQTNSTAYVPPGEGCYYYTGANWGGNSSHVLRAIDHLVKSIDADLSQGIIARFHDESHLNRYFIDHPPSLKLPPSFYLPKIEMHWPRLRHFPRKILALPKDHAEIRNYTRRKK